MTMHSGQFGDEMLKTEDLFGHLDFDMEDLLVDPFDNLGLKLEEEHCFKQVQYHSLIWSLNA